MSASPHTDPPPPPTVPSPHSAPLPHVQGLISATPTTISPPLISSAPSPPSGDARLLAVLSDTIRERDDLQRDVSSLQKRLERVERLLLSFSQSSSSSPSGSSPQIHNAFHEYEARLEAAESAREEAEARRRVILDNWLVLLRHFEFLEAQTLEARANFSRLLREGGPPLLDPSTQVQSGQSFSSQSTTHPIYVMPPPVHPARHHISSSRPGSSRTALPTPQTSIQFSNMSLPPPPNTKHHTSNRGRPRASSVDGSMDISGQPPSKKAKQSRYESERRSRSDRIIFTESPVESPLLHNPQYNQSLPYSQPAPSLAHQTTHPVHQSHRSLDSREHEEYLQRTSHDQFSRDHTRIHTSEPDQPEDSLHFPENESRHRGRRARHSRRPHRSKHRGSSRSSSRSSASSLIDALLDAASPDDIERKTAGPNGFAFNIPSLPHKAFRRLAASSYISRNELYPQASSRMRPDSPSSDYRSHTTRGTSHLHDHPTIQTGVPMTGPGMSAEAVAGPLTQPGQLQMYQTHVFAPVVTGAPVKKTKYREEFPPPAPSDVIHRPAPPAAPEAAAPPPPSFPATNAQGQRICRQCGMPGRYKDGKCVEKWGPGPHGSGTVCDRCRKKMKRVERRGTMEVQQHASMQSVSTGNVRAPPIRQTPSRGSQHMPAAPAERAMHRTDTLPITQPPKQQQQQLGPGSTQIITTEPPSASTSYAQRPQAPSQPPQPQAARTTGVRTGSSSGSSPQTGRAPPPSPPAIATLDDGGSVDNSSGLLRPPPPPGSRSHSRSSSRSRSRQAGTTATGDGNHRPSPSAPPAATASAKRSPNGSGHPKSAAGSPRGRAGSGDGDNDGDADAEAEPDIDADAELDIDAALDAAAATRGDGMDVDADAEAELLEAVDAAEANTTGSHGTGAAAATSWLKNQD